MKALSVKELEKAIGTLNGDPEWFEKERIKELVLFERLIDLTGVKTKPVRYVS